MILAYLGFLVVCSNYGVVSSVILVFLGFFVICPNYAVVSSVILAFPGDSSGFVSTVQLSLL